MQEVGGDPPVVSTQISDDDLPVDAMHYTVEQHYRELEQRLPLDDETFFDGDLLTIFTSEQSGDGNERLASRFLDEHRRELVARIGYWTGEGPGIVGAFIDLLSRRAQELGLYARLREASTLIELTAFGTAVMMNYRYTDSLGRAEQEEEMP
jgi:hypothetical protein